MDNIEGGIVECHLWETNDGYRGNSKTIPKLLFLSKLVLTAIMSDKQELIFQKFLHGPALDLRLLSQGLQLLVRGKKHFLWRDVIGINERKSKRLATRDLQVRLPLRPIATPKN